MQSLFRFVSILGCGRHVKSKHFDLTKSHSHLNILPLNAHPDFIFQMTWMAASFLKNSFISCTFQLVGNVKRGQKVPSNWKLAKQQKDRSGGMWYEMTWKWKKEESVIGLEIFAFFSYHLLLLAQEMPVTANAACMKVMYYSLYKHAYSHYVIQWYCTLLLNLSPCCVLEPKVTNVSM